MINTATKNIIATTHCGNARRQMFNTSLHSLLLFSTVDIHILSDNRNLSLSLHSHPRILYHFVDRSYIHRFSRCAGARFELLNILSNSDKRYILYIDGDVIATESLMPLFKEDLNKEAWSAFVLERTRGRYKSWYESRRMQNVVHGVGINSGVWLFNNVRTKPLIEFVHNNMNLSFPLWDQTLLNIYFHRYPKELKLLDCKWNMRHNCHCNAPSGLFHGTNKIFEPKNGWWKGAILLKQRLKYALQANASSIVLHRRL